MAKGPKPEGETSSDDKALQSILAIRVREARKDAKLSQAELATLIGTSQSNIFLIEAAEVNITMKTLVRLAQALKVNPIDLLMPIKVSSVLDIKIVQTLAALVQASIQEAHATTRNLTKIHGLLQEINDILTEHQEGLPLPPVVES